MSSCSTELSMRLNAQTIGETDAGEDVCGGDAVALVLRAYARVKAECFKLKDGVSIAGRSCLIILDADRLSEIWSMIRYEAEALSIYRAVTLLPSGLTRVCWSKLTVHLVIWKAL